MIRRRWLAGSLVEELTLRNPHPLPVSVHLELEVAADFAHVFDVKSGIQPARTRPRPEADSPARWTLRSPHDEHDRTEVVLHPEPDEVDPAPRYGGLASAHRRDGTRSTVTVTVQPVSAGVPAELERPSELARGVAIRELSSLAVGGPDRWSRSIRACLPPSTRRWPTWPPCASSTGRTPTAPVVAAGAPWFMTLFGRDSLLTAWMTLPFDGSLAGGVLASLADLQGTRGRPGVRGAAGPDPARAAAPRRQRAVLLPQPLLRHGRRDAALRRARRRGVAVAGDRRGHPPPPGAGRRSRRRLDHRTR